MSRCTDNGKIKILIKSELLLFLFWFIIVVIVVISSNIYGQEKVYFVLYTDSNVDLSDKTSQFRTPHTAILGAGVAPSV
jgi:hypothetical protein